MVTLPTLRHVVVQGSLDDGDDAGRQKPEGREEIAEGVEDDTLPHLTTLSGQFSQVRLSQFRGKEPISYHSSPGATPGKGHHTGNA